MKKYKSYIASLLLVLFVTAQLSVLHAHTHEQDDAPDCELCIVAQDFSQQDFQFTSAVQLPQPVLVHHTTPITILDEDQVSIFISSYYPSRPPPSTC